MRDRSSFCFKITKIYKACHGWLHNMETQAKLATELVSPMMMVRLPIASLQPRFADGLDIPCDDEVLLRIRYE